MKRVKQFDRGRYWLRIDTKTGQKWKIPKDESKPPGMIRKAANFAGAATKHVAKGRPKASKETIEKRFRKCCGCEKFEVLATESVPKPLRDLEQVGTCNHKQCGCYIHDSELFPNKLAWSSQSCPLNKWGKE